MFFNTLDEYDKELANIKNRMNSMENRMAKHPDRAWIRGNYYSYKE